MVTRFYLPASASSTPITPTPDAGWEDTSIVARAMTSTATIGDAMATVSFTDNDATNKDVCFRQYVSLELEAGQTINQAQTVKLVCRAKERDASCNLFTALGIRVINGVTVNKTVLAVFRDSTEANATTLTNRALSTNSAVGNYTTVAGDRLVIEIGMGGDPNAGSDHDSDMRLGDSAASDLAEDDTTTTDNRPWVQLNDTLAFVFSATGTLTHAGASLTGSATFVAPTYSGTSALTHAGATLVGSATFTGGVETYTGMASLSHTSATLTGAAEFDAPVYTGTAGFIHQGASLNGSATFAPPIYSSTATLSHLGASYSGSAEFDAPTYSGASSLVHSGASLSGSATFIAPIYSGTASLNHSSASLTASGSVPISGTAGLVHGGASFSSAGAFTPPVYSGSSNLTHGGAVLAGSAMFLAPVTGVGILSHSGAVLAGAAKTVFAFRKTKATVTSQRPSTDVSSRAPKIIAIGRSGA